MTAPNPGRYDTPLAASIVILNYNGRAWLERCLAAAVSEVAPDCELIVVDNGSSDGSADFVQQAFPAFHQLGGFDSAFFAVYEDVDLSYRFQLRGYGCMYVPHAVVHHAGSATLGRLSTRAVFWGQRNLEWMLLQEHPLVAAAGDSSGPRRVRPGCRGVFRQVRAPADVSLREVERGARGGARLATAS